MDIKPLLGAFAVFGLIIAVVGGYFYTDYLSGAPKPQPRGTTGIVMGSWPDHNITEVGFELTVNPKDKMIIPAVRLSYYGTGDYRFLVTLPYYIKELRPYGDEGNWTYRNAESGSVLMVSFYNQQRNDSMGFRRMYSVIDVDNPIVQSNYGVYTLDIPFGGSMSPDVQREKEQLPVHVPTSDSAAKYYTVDLSRNCVCA